MIVVNTNDLFGKSIPTSHYKKDQWYASFLPSRLVVFPITWPRNSCSAHLTVGRSHNWLNHELNQWQLLNHKLNDESTLQEYQHCLKMLVTCILRCFLVHPYLSRSFNCMEIRLIRLAIVTQCGRELKSGTTNQDLTNHIRVVNGP